MAVNREKALVSSSRALFADLVFCGGYRGLISAANAEGQDGLIEPEKTHLRIKQNKATTRILPHGAKLFWLYANNGGNPDPKNS
jgi:hypothetical protein